MKKTAKTGTPKAFEKIQGPGNFAKKVKPFHGSAMKGTGTSKNKSK